NIINKNMQLPIVEMAEFVERGFGDAEGMTKEEREKNFPGMRTYPNQESKEAVRKRVTKGIDMILQKYPNKKIMLISHGGTINTILSILSAGEIGSGKTKLITACFSNIEH